MIKFWSSCPGVYLFWRWFSAPVLLHWQSPLPMIIMKLLFHPNTHTVTKQFCGLIYLFLQINLSVSAFKPHITVSHFPSKPCTLVSIFDSWQDPLFTLIAIVIEWHYSLACTGARIIIRSLFYNYSHHYIYSHHYSIIINIIVYSHHYSIIIHIIIIYSHHYSIIIYLHHYSIIIHIIIYIHIIIQSLFTSLYIFTSLFFHYSHHYVFTSFYHYSHHYIFTSLFYHYSHNIFTSLLYLMVQFLLDFVV